MDLQAASLVYSLAELGTQDDSISSFRWIAGAFLRARVFRRRSR